jgi:methyltransferase family protein
LSIALEATDLQAWADLNVDMAPHYRTLIRLAGEAKTIIEWGVRGGVSTWALLEGLPPDGRLFSVDIIPCIVPPRVSGDPRWTFIVGDDLSPAVREQLPGQADLVFIDTEHTYEQAGAELHLAEQYSPKRIVLHDINQPQMRSAVDDFCAASDWRMVAYEDPFGLATLER